MTALVLSVCTGVAGMLVGVAVGAGVGYHECVRELRDAARALRRLDADERGPA
jgi:hypothetical protein